ncbi:unnamed protein product [Schistocephalus solidus]|uniref:Reverse transcriptase domain-containing protein n=1 Tax=Schistocephalus solidus TaxID=70667 RepID=A0A183TEK0_SCHSO|nr:unnamed protein product [Schistocephalus solidus]
MQASTRVSTTTVHDLLFADECTLDTVTEEDMQRIMDLFAAGCANFGLTISTPKTVVMHQPPPSVEYNAPRINVKCAQIKNVETFFYLGSTLFFPVATPRATVTTGGLNQVRVSGVVCASTPEQRDAGVAFAIRNNIVGRLPGLPQGIYDHLMSVCPNLWGEKFAIIIIAYAPPHDEL